MIRFGIRPLPLGKIAHRLGYGSHRSLTTLAERYERTYSLGPGDREQPAAYADREAGQEGFSLVAA